jgi:ribonuclease HI
MLEGYGEANQVSEDPHALKLYIDGNAFNNPGGTGGFACFAEFPESWDRPDEEIFRQGFHETSNNRMELRACICALEYVRDQGSSLGVQRVQIVTDSRYVCDNQKFAHYWRRNGWTTNANRPVENSDLWKKFLSVRPLARIRTDILWRKGKKSPILKSVDRAAKEAGKSPSKPDRGFRSGKIGRSKVKGGASSLFPAKGQEEVIHIYKSALLRKTDHKVYFNVLDGRSGEFVYKHTAYVSAPFIEELHRGHSYRVSFNFDSNYPQIIQIHENCSARPFKAESPGPSHGGVSKLS